MGKATDYTKSDTNTGSFNWVMVNTAGSLVVDHKGGDQTTLVNVPANVWIPVGEAVRVRLASTAVGIMVV